MDTNSMRLYQAVRGGDRNEAAAKNPWNLSKYNKDESKILIFIGFNNRLFNQIQSNQMFY
jgi:hypothetical protein